MYAAGVRGGSAKGGVYLWSGESEGWGRSGLGAQDRFEPIGQNRGRWFSTLPFGVLPTDSPCSAQTYNGRTYLVGGYAYNLVLDEHHRLWRQGIVPPLDAPTIAGGGVGSSTIAYLSWWDEKTGERSPLSKGFAMGTSGPRTWSLLPTRPPDDVFISDESLAVEAAAPKTRIRWPAQSKRIPNLRPGDRLFATWAPTTYAMMVNRVKALVPAGIGPAIVDAWYPEQNTVGAVGFAGVTVAPITRATHLELWLSFAGDLPRLAMRVAIGCTSVVENKGIADLGEAFVTQFQRFPRGTMNAIYHDRQIVAGDAENPDTVFLSSLYFPERFEGLQFRTRDGRPITGLLATRDFCMVFTRTSAALLQGYTDTDYTMNPVDQSIGSVGHLCNRLIHGNPYVWSEQGPMMYNGGWHPLSPENRWHPPDNGANMVATDDPYFHTYIVSNAHHASKSINEPYCHYDESGSAPVTSDFPPDSNGPAAVQADAAGAPKFFSVLDYTMVQPEAGGAQEPARASWDRGELFYQQFTEDPPNVDLETRQFMMYLRNRFGRGNLYKVLGIPRNFHPSSPADTPGPATPSFKISGMLLPLARQQLNLGNVEIGEIITGFDYLGDAGGYLMEQKQVKRIWYFLRMSDGFARMNAAPGPGYWGTRIFSGVQPPPPGGVAPFRHQVDFVAGDYQSAPDVPFGDVVMPVLPDFVSGRGIWIHIRGTNLFFAGYGLETAYGSEGSQKT